MSKAYEPGHSGQLVSLGGVLGKPGLGRLHFVRGMTASTIGQSALESNGRRISAIIQNLSSDTPILVDFGQSGEPSISIYPHGTLQIDKDFPWTGSLWVYTSAGTASMYASEISVQ